MSKLSSGNISPFIPLVNFCAEKQCMFSKVTILDFWDSLKIRLFQTSFVNFVIFLILLCYPNNMH